LSLLVYVYLTGSYKSSTVRESRIVVYGRYSLVSSFVVMATRTCQSILCDSRSGGLAKVPGWRCLGTGFFLFI